MLGTEWVTPGKGDDLATLLRAINDAGLGPVEPIKPGDDARLTNLRLTGQSIKPYDHDRLRYVTVQNS